MILAQFSSAIMMEKKSFIPVVSTQ